VVSVVATGDCNALQSLTFERYWSERCDLVLLHFYDGRVQCNPKQISEMYAKLNSHATANGAGEYTEGVSGEEKIKRRGNAQHHLVAISNPSRDDEYYRNINTNVLIVRHDMMKRRCFMCIQDVEWPLEFYKKLRAFKRIDILKLQLHSASHLSPDVNDVMVYKVLRDLHLYKLTAFQDIRQIVFRAALTPAILSASNTYGLINIHGAADFLRQYESFSTVTGSGDSSMSLSPFANSLQKADIDVGINYYIYSFQKILGDSRKKGGEYPYPDYDDWLTRTSSSSVHNDSTLASLVTANFPSYCTLPSSPAEVAAMQAWLTRELTARCPIALLSECDRSVSFSPFYPCKEQLVAALVEEYAAAAQWCEYSSDYAAVPPLSSVSIAATRAFQKQSEKSTVCFAFFIIFRSDADMLVRLFKKVYSPRHYYLIHTDHTTNGGVRLEDELKVRDLATNRLNVHLTSQANRFGDACLLTQAMAWFVRHSTGWDYFVSLTGQEYLLMSLTAMEEMVYNQKRKQPMPYVMVWSTELTERITAALAKDKKYERDATLFRAVDRILKTRRPGASRPYYVTSFTPVVQCHEHSFVYRFENRRVLKPRAGDAVTGVGQMGRVGGNSSIDNGAGAGGTGRATVRAMNSLGEMGGTARTHTQWLFSNALYGGKLSGSAAMYKDPALSTPPPDGVRRVWVRSDPATTALYDRESVEYIVNSDEGRKYYHFFKYAPQTAEEHYFASLLYNWARTSSFVSSASAQASWFAWNSSVYTPEDASLTRSSMIKRHPVLTEEHIDVISGLSKLGVFFCGKVHSKISEKILNHIDRSIINNKAFKPGKDRINAIT